ncbi:hypothetical protein SAMN02927937_02604 [Paenimyroides aquimaris]|uniref:Uncharacterized protein n=1 Tax=Paenimyroides marinum TaxID=1159016 RepID=A0A1H6MCT4_9FLAO|nr:hypothetical protein [Paenimyroides aquimaris]SEH99334.1 hypothetical protein SAMN02927937_02604 [Paenimyroides aquimaris]
MKKLIYIIILMASLNIYAQNAIETDELFLKYEQEYLKAVSSEDGRNYELANKNFNSKFNDYKQRNKFQKSKDKERWLSKNFSKTEFSSADEALQTYKDMVELSTLIKDRNNAIQEIRNELLKKYDETLIWETLQARLKARK